MPVTAAPATMPSRGPLVENPHNATKVHELPRERALPGELPPEQAANQLRVDELTALCKFMTAAVDIKVERSGGIRDDESLKRAMDSGCTRVNIGTAAIEDPEWCARAIATYGDRVAIGLDVRGRTLAARGWTREGGDLYETITRLDSEGCARYVVTDVNKDGMLQGPNLDLLRDVCAATSAPVVASGGVTTIEDIAALMTLVRPGSAGGVEGAIAGNALYTGSLSLAEALALTRSVVEPVETPEGRA